MSTTTRRCSGTSRTRATSSSSHVAPWQPDRRPRGLRRRRRLLDRDPRRRAARPRGRSRVAYPEPAGGRLRLDPTHCRSAVGAGHRVADHGRLRDHAVRGDRPRPGRRTSTRSSPTTTSRPIRCRTARSSIRCSSGYPFADLCASGRSPQALGRAPATSPASGGGARRARSGGARHDLRRRAAARREPATGSGRARRAPAHAPARTAGPDALAGWSRGQPTSGRPGFRLGPEDQRRRPDADRRGGARAGAHRG